MMQAYKFKGQIDRSGKLIITEPTHLNPGDVEVIILQSVKTIEDQASNDQSSKKRPSKVKTFQQWFTKTEANLSDLQLDEVKWKYLQEKHNL